MRLLALVSLSLGLACGEDNPARPVAFVSLNRDTVEQSLTWPEWGLEAQVRWFRESLYVLDPGQTRGGSPSYHLVVSLEMLFHNVGSAGHSYSMRLVCFTDRLGFTIGCTEAPGYFNLDPDGTFAAAGHVQVQVADVAEANAIGRVAIDIQLAGQVGITAKWAGPKQLVLE